MNPSIQDQVQVAAELLDAVTEANVAHAIAGMEGLVAKLKAEAEHAATAREALRHTPAEVLREALRVRAARLEVTR